MASALHAFVRDEALPGSGIDEDKFWAGFEGIVEDLAPRNRELLARRDELQRQLDEWHTAHPGPVQDQAAYLQLHRLGWVHSVEAWRDGQLAGGLYGVAVGGLFAGESMFHRERDASKVALLGLCRLLDDEYADTRLVDTQWRTPHLASLGVVEIPRREYLRRLALALRIPLPRFAGRDPRG